MPETAQSQPDVVTQARARLALIVDADSTARSWLERGLTGRGFRVSALARLEQAWLVADALAPTLVILDIGSPDPESLALIEKLKSLRCNPVVVVLTSRGSIAAAVECVRRGASRYLAKPAPVDEILETFESPVAAPIGRDAGVPTLARVEWEHIQRVLTDAGGNVTLAARRLGVHRRSLQRKLWRTPSAR